MRFRFHNLRRVCLTLLFLSTFPLQPASAQSFGSAYVRKWEPLQFADGAEAVYKNAKDFYANLDSMKMDMECYSGGKSKTGSGDLEGTFAIDFKKPSFIRRTETVPFRVSNLSGDPPLAGSYRSVMAAGTGNVTVKEAMGKFNLKWDSELVCDGKQIFIYDRRTKRYTVRTITEGEPLSAMHLYDNFTSPLKYLLFDREHFSELEGAVRLAGVDTIDGRLCQRLICVPSPKQAQHSKEVWIEKGDTPWVRKIKDASKDGDGGHSLVVTFRNLQKNPSLPDSAFTPAPRPGYKLTFALDPFDEPTNPSFSGQVQMVGKKAPRFQMRLLNEQTVEPLSASANTPAVLYFWSSHCAACPQIFDELLEAIGQQKPNSIKLYAIDREGFDEIKEMMSKHKIPSFVTSGLVDKEVFRKYSIGFVPTVFFVDKGKIVRQLGSGDVADQLNFFLHEIKTATN